MQDRKDDHDTTIHVIAERVNSVQNNLIDLKNEIRDSMKEISTAVTKLVQMEERQIHMNQSNEELKACFKELESRVDSIEKDQPETKRIVGYAYKALWTAMLAVCAFIAKAVGLV